MVFSGLMLLVFFMSIMPLMAENGVDTTTDPTVWAVITLNDADGPYGTLGMAGWYSWAPGADDIYTLNHWVEQVVCVDGRIETESRLALGDRVYTTYGYYEEGGLKWIHNGKDFQIHLEVDFASSPSSNPYPGSYYKEISGKTYGRNVWGTINWHYWGTARPPIITWS